ncbi:MAG: PaaI family thioesterase [candidate division Zixibacteria bacterium]|nr:PaaI family thioesterase [candidate division Zixibacteria bacterium]
MKEIPKYSNCFVCGDKNIHGLAARFYYDGSQAITEVVATEQFEGYRDIYHGGIISTLLDEVMIKAILAEERFALTAEITVRFLKPVRIGDKLTFIGKVVKSKGRVFITEGEVKNSQDEICATAAGKYLEAQAGLRQDLMKSID